MPDQPAQAPPMARKLEEKAKPKELLMDKSSTYLNTLRQRSE
ncbi:hypothetical protein [Coxiella endosymbiont of Ornithodoros maritimus]|nr:hypothetical protein [Coxiella endosymbiont of Ornithodoros maritimus]